MAKRGNIERALLISAIILFSVAILLNPAEARQSKTFANEIMVDLVRYDPSPVQPGEPFELWLELRNVYGEDLSDIEISLSPPFPFTKIKGETYLRTFSTLKQDEVKQVKYTLLTDVTTGDGDYDLSLNYYSNRLKEVAIEKFAVKVKNVETEVSAVSITVEPKEIFSREIAPGETAKVGVTISNSADSLMKDITIKLDLNSSAIPFMPIGTTAEKKIKEIPSGRSASISFDIFVLPNTDAGAYKIPVKITYYDELGDSYTKDELIGLIVGSPPKLHIEIRENEIYNVFGTGNVVLNLVNEGVIDMKAAKVSLKEPLNKFGIPNLNLGVRVYEILSEDNLYVGDIDVDDTESVKFRIKLKTFGKRITLPLTITYRDANNKEYTEDRTIEFEIHSKKEMGLASKSYGWLTIVVIIAIIIFFDFRTWKKTYKEHGFLDYLTGVPTRFASRFHRKRRVREHRKHYP